MPAYLRETPPDCWTCKRTLATSVGNVALSAIKAADEDATKRAVASARESADGISPCTFVPNPGCFETSGLWNPDKGSPPDGCAGRGEVMNKRPCEVIDLDAEPDVDASHALALRLQAEQDSCYARELQRKEGYMAAQAPTLAKTPGQSTPPSTLRAAEDSKTMCVLRSMLAPFSPQVCADPVSMASQHDNWTCGYENLAALLRSLTARRSIGAPNDLSPGSLQRIVEGAWRAGFDPESARQLRPLCGTRKWLGAAEMAAALWHLRFDAQLIEIAGVPRLAGRVRGSGAALCAAVCATLGRCTDLPLILQHAGHSRSVIGLTSTPSGLLLRDPSDPLTQFRWVSSQDLDGRQYQLVLIRNRSAGGPVSPRLSTEKAHARAGEPTPAAVWFSAGWQYADWCRMRF